MAAGAKALYDHYIYQYKSLLGTRKVELGQSRLRWLLTYPGVISPSSSPAVVMMQTAQNGNSKDGLSSH